MFDPKRYVCVLALSALIVAACSGGDDELKWTDSEVEASTHYFNSMRDNKEASRVARSAGNRFTPQQQAEVKALTRSALAEAQKVDDKFLDKANPALKKHFREEYQTALELALVNLDHPDYESAKKASQLFSDFADWHKAHLEDIHTPR